MHRLDLMNTIAAPAVRSSVKKTPRAACIKPTRPTLDTLLPWQRSVHITGDIHHGVVHLLVRKATHVDSGLRHHLPTMHSYALDIRLCHCLKELLMCPTLQQTNCSRCGCFLSIITRYPTRYKPGTAEHPSVLVVNRVYSWPSDSPLANSVP